MELIKGNMLEKDCKFSVYNLLIEDGDSLSDSTKRGLTKDIRKIISRETDGEIDSLDISINIHLVKKFRSTDKQDLGDKQNG